MVIKLSNAGKERKKKLKKESKGFQKQSEVQKGCKKMTCFEAQSLYGNNL